MDWIDLAQDRVRWWAFVNVVMKCGEFLEWLNVSFSGTSLLHGVIDKVPEDHVAWWWVGTHTEYRMLLQVCSDRIPFF
jgi:hypothetical protein